MELALKINSVSDDHSHCQDGDVVCIFSNSQIHFCHAHMICHPRKFALNTFGLRDEGTLLQKYMEKTHQYKFTRLNSNELQRLNLLTGEEDTLSSTPNAKGEVIDVALFISRRVKNNEHKIFGVSHGNEVWYGKELSRRVMSVDAIWNDIETHSDHLKEDHCRWPFSDREKRAFLPLNCTGFKDGVARDASSGTCATRHDAITVEVDDPEPHSVVVALHQWYVPYWDLASELGINIDDVRNHDKEVDGRQDVPIEDRHHMDNLYVDKLEAGIITL